MQNHPNQQHANNTNKPAPMVKVAGLYRNERQRDGAEYFTGFMGLAKVLILPNPERVEGCDPKTPTHNLFIVEKTPKESK
jgi:hypothetical protein